MVTSVPRCRVKAKERSEGTIEGGHGVLLVVQYRWVPYRISGARDNLLLVTRTWTQQSDSLDSTFLPSKLKINLVCHYNVT